ncbi:MAG: alpha/beta hydrolase [Crocosphaera sp.]|nr:alpha/beta hydrolase [Crocosphaera sp.]
MMVRWQWQKQLKTLLSISSLLLGTTLAFKATAAEEITFYYGSFAQTVEVESLETFADNGTVNPDLRTIFNIVKPNEVVKSKFQQALVTPININAALLSRLLNTDEGDRILNELGTLIEMQGGTNGKSVLRGSMIQAAASDEGFTILNFLQTLPTNMQINVRETLRWAQQASFLVKATENLVKTAENLSLQASEAVTTNFSQLPNPGETGSISFTRDRWNLTDKERNRRFYVEVYRPQLPASQEIPVIVFSHGLGERPETYQKMAELLASQGFLVAMPQHPGSDTEYKKDLAEGFTRSIFNLNEFIDRPLDLSYTLDELEKRNKTEFDGQLNLRKVGAFGHSFGGYTALAVAGATVDMKHLQKDCNSTASRFNQAILLQCRALKLEQPIPKLKDERIGAVLVYNPVNASIFGPEGLANVKVPVFVGAGTYDLTTPFVFEQMRSFPWLVNAPESYLMIQQGDSHVPLAKLGAGSHFTATSLLKLTLPHEQLRAYYAAPSVVAFAQVYVAAQEDYRVYLYPAYASYLSEGQDFKAFLITEKSASNLLESFQQQVEGFKNL